MKITLAPSTLIALFPIISIHVSYAKQGVIMWIAFIWLMRETGAGSCKNGNKPHVSIKGGKFLELVEQLLIS